MKTEIYEYNQNILAEYEQSFRAAADKDSWLVLNELGSDDQNTLRRLFEVLRDSEHCPRVFEAYTSVVDAAAEKYAKRAMAARKILWEEEN